MAATDHLNPGQFNGLPDYYHGTTVETHPAKDWTNNRGTQIHSPSWSVYHGKTDTWMNPPVNPAQFSGIYHASEHDFKPGDEIVSARELNPEHPSHAAANPFADEDERSYDTTYASTDPSYAQKRWGSQVYRVQPMGAMFPDRTGTDSSDMEVEGHLKVLGRA